MRVSISLAAAEALARDLYTGSSSPLTEPRPGHRPLDCEWWRSPRKSEAFSTARHKGALALYLDLARHCIMKLPEGAFPSSFDFSDRRTRNPDKGFVKACLNTDPALLGCETIAGHLIFVVTEAGQNLIGRE